MSIISPESGPEEYESLVMAFHNIVGKLPVTARSKNKTGILIINGEILSREYSGPVLEKVIREGKTIKEIPDSGRFKGVPVIVSPVIDGTGVTIGAVGIVDITGIFDLATLMDHQADIIRQVCGSDPCPLPSERVASKR
jgi:hypothetical protein